MKIVDLGTSSRINLVKFALHIYFIPVPKTQKEEVMDYMTVNGRWVMVNLVHFKQI